MGSNKEFLNFAIELSREAGNLIMDFREKQLERIYTSRTHFRTVVDEAVDKLLFERISQRFPDHGIYSEEGGGSLNGRPFTWVNDSVDGTINLWSNYVDHVACCIALCEGKTPIVGVVNAVIRKELYFAEQGKGAFLNNRRIHVSETREISKVLMSTGSGKKDDRTAHLRYLQKAFSPEGVTNAVTGNCASVPLVLVASGVWDAFLATSLEPEDMAAAVVIIREAGGKVTNLKGEEWQLGDSSILAANPVLHQKLSDFFGI